MENHFPKAGAGEILRVMKEKEVKGRYGKERQDEAGKNRREV